MKNLKPMTIEEAVKFIKEYNEKHKTSYSYGKFPYKKLLFKEKK